MFLRYNVFTLTWLLVILLLTLTPGENMPKATLWDELISIDKAAHLFIFAVLVFLMIIGLTKQYTFLFLRRYSYQVSLVAGICYGFIIEVMQTLVPGRGFELSDIIANIIGCLVGFGIFLLVYKF